MPDHTKTCCFTGHRDIPKQDYEKLATAICSTVSDLIDRGYTEFICGGALGFDTIAAVTVINLKRLSPSIRLVIAQPCPQQADRWNASDRALYRRILERADGVVTLFDRYENGCMHARNRYMVDRSDAVIAYVKHEGGGSAYTLAYARKKGIAIINLANL